MSFRSWLRDALDVYVQWNWSWTFDAALRYGVVSEQLGRLASVGVWRICDVGCGARGGLVNYFQSPIVGVDLNFEPRIVRRFPLCRPVRGSALALPVGDETFDVVVCLDVLEHVAAGERTLVVDELFRVVRRSGWVFVGAPCGLEARQAEEEANALFRRRAGRDHPWLIEHLRNEPLSCEEMGSWISRAAARRMGEFELRAFPNTSLALWRRLHRLMWSVPQSIQFQRLLFQPWFAWLKRQAGPPWYRQVWSARSSGWGA